MDDRPSWENQNLKQLRLLIYLVPIVGIFPATWTLYRRQGTRQQRNLSRTALILFVGWLSGYALLGVGSQSAAPNLSLLIVNSIFTSGYFLVNLWLMLRVLQHQSVRLPIASKLSDRLP
jgi:hypothetical protein